MLEEAKQEEVQEIVNVTEKKYFVGREVEGKMEHIKKKIEEYSLHRYTFYVYVFPFMKLDETRKDIIKKITLAE